MYLRRIEALELIFLADEEYDEEDEEEDEGDDDGDDNPMHIVTDAHVSTSFPI